MLSFLDGHKFAKEKNHTAYSSIERIWTINRFDMKPSLLHTIIIYIYIYIYIFGINGLGLMSPKLDSFRDNVRHRHLTNES